MNSKKPCRMKGSDPRTQSEMDTEENLTWVRGDLAIFLGDGMVIDAVVWLVTTDGLQARN
jgi:hypothetical protein